MFGGNYTVAKAPEVFRKEMEPNDSLIGWFGGNLASGWFWTTLIGAGHGSVLSGLLIWPFVRNTVPEYLVGVSDEGIHIYKNSVFRRGWVVRGFREKSENFFFTYGQIERVRYKPSILKYKLEISFGFNKQMTLHGRRRNKPEFGNKLTMAEMASYVEGKLIVSHVESKL